MRPLVRTDADTDIVGWGTPPVDITVVDSPTSTAAAVVTQETQSANEAQRAAAAVAQLPPPPFGIAIADADGRLNQAWMGWFTRLYRRSGAAIVTPAGDMDILTEFDDIPVSVHMPADPMDWLGGDPVNTRKDLTSDALLWDDTAAVKAWVKSQIASPAAHQMDGALHTVSGLTAGHFLKALSATTFGFAAHGLAYSDVGALAVGGTATDSDKLDGQHGAYYQIAIVATPAIGLDAKTDSQKITDLIACLRAQGILGPNA